MSPAVPLSDKGDKTKSPLAPDAEVDTMWGRSWGQTLVSYQGYLCCVCHNRSQKGNILRALCLVICRPTRRNLFVWHVLMPLEIQMWSQSCQFVPLLPGLIRVLLFSPRTCPLWSVQTSPDSGVGVRGHSVGVSRASVVLFPDSNITPTLRHPAINPTLGGDWRRHGERAETWAEQWLPGQYD